MRVTTGTMTVGILAIMAGLIGAYAIRASLVKEPVAPPKIVTVAVPLASIDLPEGRTIALGDIGLLEMTKEEMQSRKYPMSQVMLNPEQIIGRTLRATIKQGEPFLTTSLYLDGSGPDVSQLLKPGYRAATVTVRDRNSVLPAQGNIVDVVFRSSPKEAKKGGLDIPETTLTLLHGVEVIGVKQARPANNSASNGRNNVIDLRRGAASDVPPPIVTLAVTLEQANMIKAVEGRGELSFVVRSSKESTASLDRREQKTTLENVLGLEQKPDLTFTTEIYRAGDRQTLKFQRGFIIDESYSGPPRRATPVSPTTVPGINAQQPTAAHVAPGAPTALTTQQ